MIPAMPPASRGQRNDTNLAVVVIVFTVFSLSLGDALIKTMSADLGLWQIFVLRSLLALPVLIAVLQFKKIPLLPRVSGWTLLRSLMLVAMWIAYYASLPHLPLSAAAATYYTLPIFITLFSAFFAGETIRPLGWIAVAVAFSGMLLLVRPATDAFNVYAVLPLASAVLYAMAMILTKTRCRNEHPLMLSLALNVSFVVVGLLATAFGAAVGDAGAPSFLSAPWAPLTTETLGAVAVMAAAILIGSVGAAIAYQKGPPSVVGTFDFAYVGFAAMWGFLFFTELPDAYSIAGILLIATGGILSIRQSSR